MDLESDLLPDWDDGLEETLRGEEVQAALREVERETGGVGVTELPQVLKKAQREVAAEGYFAGSLARRLGRIVDEDTIIDLAIGAGVPLPAALQSMLEAGYEVAVVPVGDREYLMTVEEMAASLEHAERSAPEIIVRYLDEHLALSRKLAQLIGTATVASLFMARAGLNYRYVCREPEAHKMLSNDPELSRCLRPETAHACRCRPPVKRLP